MTKLHIVGRWSDLGGGDLVMSAGPYKDVAVMLGVTLITGSKVSSSHLLSFPGYEASLIAEGFRRLYRNECEEVFLPCDAPGFALRFGWHDIDRSIAELNGRLVQEEVASPEQLWRFSLEVEQFRFDGFFLDHIAGLITEVVCDYGIDTSSPQGDR